MLTIFAATDGGTLEDACGSDPTWICERVFDLTDSAAWTKSIDWIAAKPLSVLLTVIVAAIAARIVRWAITRTMNRMAGRSPSKRSGSKRRSRRTRWSTADMFLAAGDTSVRAEARFKTLNAVFRSIGTVVVWVIAIVTILDILGINLGPVLATAGIAGVALGFGAQKMVQDFIGGFFIVAEDQFGVGDEIDLGGGAIGVVERISLRSTHLRDVRGTVWHVANGEILRVANSSQEWSRALIDVVLPYSVDVDVADGLMQEVADSMQADPDWGSKILERAEIWGIQDFGSDGVHVRMVIKTKPAAQFGVLRELRGRLKSAFDSRGIVFAYAGGTRLTMEPLPKAPTGPVTTTEPNMPDSDGIGSGVGISGEHDVDGGDVADGHDH